MVPLPFKDQKSANSVKREMQNLSAKIGVQIKPAFQSKKISQVLSPKEKKPPIVNNQCVVYKFQCDLCDTDYVGYTTRHLHQHIGEHKHSATGRRLEDHGLSKSDLKDKQFSVLRKCRSKFDCLIFEMLFIKEVHSFSTSPHFLFTPGALITSLSPPENGNETIAAHRLLLIVQTLTS